MYPIWTIAGSALLLASLTGAAYAAEIRTAVAANFLGTFEQLAQDFEQHSGHRVRISSGSTGKLYAQIKHGAPYDVLLAADVQRPRRLEDEGDGITGTRFTYATGRIVLWSPHPEGVDADGQVLRNGDFKKLAIANPVTAPYGLAARQVLERQGVWKQLQQRLVRGENIAQTFQFVASGNAELGIVARSQLRSGKAPEGSFWEIPADQHQPIAQQAILLRRARQPQAGRELLAYLRSPEVRQQLLRLGYGATTN